MCNGDFNHLRDKIIQSLCFWKHVEGLPGALTCTCIYIYITGQYTVKKLTKILSCCNQLSSQYSKHNWNRCGNLKVFALLVRITLGYTKHCYFICKWGSRVRDSNNIRAWTNHAGKRIASSQKNAHHDESLAETFSCHLYTLGNLWRHWTKKRTC